MYCATCWVDASYCPPQSDGTYLCPGCAGFAAHLDEQQSPNRAVPAADVSPLCNCCGENYDPANADGSCGSCGYL